ncbi:MAG: hypothetical protein JXQ83_06775 [Candidatus Glassbacteria bacterium]|nr:hypothetical protein [Candidatus Glassbacteria bacterium]
MKKFGLLGLIPLFLWAGMLRAQKEVSVGTHMLADDNIFRNHTGQGDFVAVPYADLGYQFSPGQDTETLDLFYLGYSGQFFLFRELSRRDFSVHGFSAHYNHLWPESRNLLAVGGKVETRLNPEDYKYFNYTSGGFYLNYKRYLREDLMLLAGYNLTGKNFSEFPEFNYLENIFSIQTSLFLQSRTTLRFSANYYHKNYLNSISTLDSVFVEPPPVSGPMPGMGYGYGRGMFLRNLFPEDVGEGFYSYRMRADEFPSTDQFKLGFTVAQGLAEGTGITAGYTARLNPRNRNRYLSNLGESVLNNEELFDDHYSYLGHEGTLQLKQMLPAESILTLMFTVRSRRFSDRPALDLEGYPLPSGEDRRDRAVLFEAEFTKRLRPGISWITDNLELSVGFGLGSNSSNDQYYDFNDKYFIFALEKAF